MRILIVEDEFNLALLLSERLKKENYQTEIATDGQTGFYEALSDSYDLLILDIMLPKLNGTEILKQVRKENIDTKIIILAGDIEADDISTVSLSLTSSTFEGSINNSNSAKEINLTLDKNSTVKLTADTYLTSLNDDDSTYSNIDFNGYTLYVNSKALIKSKGHIQLRMCPLNLLLV